MNNLISANKYIKYLFLVIVIFSTYHLLMWTFFTSQIFDPKKGTNIGDLGRMSYQVNLLQNKEIKFTLEKRFIFAQDFKDQKIDIITIGDSFSAGGGGGENAYYQDYLATIYDKNILNLEPMSDYSSLEIALGLLNSGYLEKIKPEAIIVESVGRLVSHRFAKELNIDSNILTPVITPKRDTSPSQDVSIISTANYKIPYYFIAYNFKNNAQRNVYKFDLNKNLFSGTKGNSTLILDDDITNLHTFTSENILKVNDNFNYVAKKLKQLNIKLYFMVCSDKYDLYYDFIQENKYPKNNFFELIRPLEKEYYFVDTKKILLPLLNNGEKDIYWIDDTHWSRKASEAVSKDKIFSDNISKKKESN